MALFELSMVTSVIVKKGAEALINKWSREHAVIEALNELNIDHQPDPNDFGHIYRFALVEWGVFKPEPIVEFFREKDIEKAFRQSFYKRNQKILDEHAAGYYEHYLESGKLDQVEYDPRREFDSFRDVFENIVNRTRSAGDARLDWTIAEINAKVDELLQRYPQPQQMVEKVMAEQLAPYLSTVVRRTRNLPLTPLDPAGRESAPIGLGQVFINLDAGVKQRELPGAQPDRKRYERVSAALAHIHDNERIILLGDPGSGKSTLLRFLAYCLAQHALDPDGGWLARLKWQRQQIETAEEEASKVWAALDERQQHGRVAGQEDLPVQEIEEHWSAKAPLPLFIELRNFARSDFDAASPLALWHYFCRRLQTQGLQAAVPALEHRVLRGKVLFLLDGVDEVPPGDRPRIWQAIAALDGGVCGANRWVTTCRVLSFAKEEAPQGVPTQTLQPLNGAQIDQFILSWYQALVDAGSSGAEEAQSKTRNLQNAVGRPRLRDLAENPMLLTIMALVQSYYGTLPDERARLYQMCVETLLLRWQRVKEEAEGEELPQSLVPLGDQQQLERLLWEIAWETHSKAENREKAADIPELEVLTIARKHLGDFGRAEQFTAYTEQRAHLLVGRGGIDGRQYTFPHRTFQEYLAACHLASGRRFPQRAAELAAEGDTWREVLNLAAGTLVFNQNNREKALDGVEKVLPDQTPGAADEAGWFRVWMAADMALVVGREAAEQDEVGAELLPRLRAQLVALVSGGHLTPQQRAEAAETLGWLDDPRLDVACDVPFMIEIPAGLFLMGSKKDVDGQAYDDEEPQHPQNLPVYKIGKYPVTVRQFSLFVEAGGYDEHAYWTEAGWEKRQEQDWKDPRYWDDPRWTVPNHPVVGVSWYEAAAYCAWLKATTGRDFRLPDEAMWEKAARGTDGRIWPWGNEWDSIRLNSGNNIGRTTAVGAFPGDCSPFGIFDTAGNIREWCSGPGISETPYPFQTRAYEQDLGQESTYRSWRGGAFFFYQGDSRAACRDDDNPPDGNYYLGFRVAEHLSDPAS